RRCPVDRDSVGSIDGREVLLIRRPRSALAVDRTSRDAGRDSVYVLRAKVGDETGQWPSPVIFHTIRRSSQASRWIDTANHPGLVIYWGVETAPSLRENRACRLL